MTEEHGQIIHQYLVHMAENLPLFERFNLNRGLLKDLTLQEIHTISLIGRLDSPRMSDLSQRGHVTLGTMTVMVNKLVKKGFVKRMRDGKDRRIVRVCLTSRGRRADTLHERYHKRFMDKIMAALTESEQEQVINLVQKVAAALSE